MHHGTNDSILNFAVMLVHAHLVTNTEIVLCFFGRHERTVAH